MTTQPQDAPEEVAKPRFAPLLQSLLARTAPGHGRADKQPLEEMSAHELSVINTELAVERTLMSADGSLMAWIRTALSMISFGFTIYKVLQGFEQAGAELARASSPRAIGLFLTGLGTLAMVMGTLEYWYRVKALQGSHAYPRRRPSFIMAILMSVGGLFLFGSIIFRFL